VFEWHELESLLQNVSQRKAIGKGFSTLRSVNDNEILLTNKVWIGGYIVSSIFVNVINQRLFCTKN
jgi:hypothetical protein